MLHSRLLRYLDEVATTGSIRKAAERLNVAASAINRQILTLEEEMGAPLFERLHRRMRPTAAGEMLLAHVRQTLKEHERTQARIEDLKGLRRGQVTIATMLTLASEVLPGVIKSFRERHPKTTINVKVLRDIEATVASDEADLGFGFNLTLPPNLTACAAVAIPFGAIVAPGHPLAERGSVSLSSCASFPLILPESGMSIRPDLDAAFAKIKSEIDVAIETNAIELIKRAAAAGVGVAFLTPIPVRSECERGELVYLPLRDRLLAPQSLSIIRRQQASSNGLADRMEEMLRTTVAAMALQKPGTAEPPIERKRPFHGRSADDSNSQNISDRRRAGSERVPRC